MPRRRYCEDIHLLGTAQLTSAGTAVLKFIPGMGSHSYKAVFVGTQSDWEQFLEHGGAGGDRCKRFHNDHRSERRSGQLHT